MIKRRLIRRAGVDDKNVYTDAEIDEIINGYDDYFGEESIAIDAWQTDNGDRTLYAFYDALARLFAESLASYNELSGEAKARADKNRDDDDEDDETYWTMKGDRLTFNPDDVSGYGMIPFLRDHGYKDEVHDLVERYLYGKDERTPTYRGGSFLLQREQHH